ncbi:hypothetical protein B566_EDAN012363 [Ephemera danica]|nr:hypothetical protein B566_EDAN012363 [Ephemera danica]
MSDDEEEKLRRFAAARGGRRRSSSSWFSRELSQIQEVDTNNHYQQWINMHAKSMSGSQSPTLSAVPSSGASSPTKHSAKHADANNRFFKMLAKFLSCGYFCSVTPYLVHCNYMAALPYCCDLRPEALSTMSDDEEEKLRRFAAARGGRRRSSSSWFSRELSQIQEVDTNNHYQQWINMHAKSSGSQSPTLSAVPSSGAFSPTKHSAKHADANNRFFKMLAKFLSARDQDQSKNVEDVLFDMFKNEDTDLLPVGKFLAALRSTGLRRNDTRLQELNENLKKVHKQSGSESGAPETQKLDRETFKSVVSSNIVLISRAFRHQFVIPDFQGFTKYIEEFYWRCKDNTEGKVASYIPQLARMNPDYWGVSVKPLTYAIALDQLGAETVHQYVGQEPSGRNFNELVLDHNKRPHNPMINAGAILICTLLKTLIRQEMTLAEKFDFTMNYFKRLAGGEYLGFNNAVFLSEREAADRNYALGFYMREHNARDQDQSKNVEDVLFDMFKNEDTDLLPVGKFLAALRSTGLRRNDTRLQELNENLKKVHKQSGSESGAPETQKLDRETFKSVVSSNIVLISRAFRHQFVIPDFQGFTKYIEEFYWRCKDNTEGKVASYIPQLARMNPDYWGVSVKPLTYAIALDQLGAETVHQYVGQEPSGRNFNELVLDHNKRPHNPMINAGAILICTLLKTLIRQEMTLAEKFDFTMNYFKRLAGGEYLGFNNAVFLSEREAADRNYALGFYMREHKCYPEKTNLRECMDFYFQVGAHDSSWSLLQGLSAVWLAVLLDGGDV